MYMHVVSRWEVGMSNELTVQSSCACRVAAHRARTWLTYMLTQPVNALPPTTPQHLLWAQARYSVPAWIPYSRQSLVALSSPSLPLTSSCSCLRLVRLVHFHRALTLSAVKLSSSRHVAPGTADVTLRVAPIVERVAVLGLPPAKKGYKAGAFFGTAASRECPCRGVGPPYMVAGPHYDSACFVSYTSRTCPLHRTGRWRWWRCKAYQLLRLWTAVTGAGCGKGNASRGSSIKNFHVQQG